MRALVELCLRLRFVVALSAVAFLVVGWKAASSAQVDVFPEFAPPRAEIQTEAPGLSALEVETLITTPIERAVQGVAFLSALRSKSVLGLSSVVLVFQDGTDALKARQLVQERMATVVTQLPLGAKAPVMLAPLSSTSRVMKIGISSQKLSQMEMTDLARFTIRPRLMAVPGVANVAIWGQRDRQLQVKVNPDALQARGVRLDDVLKAARDATTPTAAGYVDTPTQRFAVTHASFATTKEALGEVVVLGRTPGTSVRLSDVATIDEGHPVPIGDAIIDDVPGLLLIVEKQPWGNTLDVTRKIEAALVALAPGLPDVKVDPTIFRPATFIERALTNLGHAIAIGCALVIGILFFFLYSFRTAIISVLAIPLSLVAAAAVLAWRGVTLDTMTVAGLVIALGEVVDDAIIDVENIQRRLAINATLAQPRSALAVVLDASLEVRSAVVYATLIVVLVFLPVYFMDGLSGAFFRPLAVAYVLAVGASLLVALTVTPALSLLLLPKAPGREKHGPLSRILRDGYESIARGTVKRTKTAGAILGAVVIVAAGLVPLLGEGFLPDFHETDFLMHWVGRPGTSVEEMDRITVRASKELRAIPGVRNFGSHIGRAEVADEVVGPNFAELWISLDEKADYAESVAAIQATVDGYPGLYHDVQTYLQERMKDVLTGASGSIVVRIYGPDLAALRAKADEVGAALKEVVGVANLKVEPQVLVPQIEVALDPAALQRFGLTAGDVRRTMATLLQGTRVGEVYRGDQVIEVVVWGDSSLRADVTAIRELRIALPVAGASSPAAAGSGSSDVRLADLASVAIVPAPNIVQRDAASRRIDVTCDARGRDLGAVANDVERAVAGISFSAGYHAEILGEYAARGKAQTRLLGLALLSLLGIALVLYADFRSARVVGFIMATLPFALVGGVAGVVTTGGVVSLGSLVGFVTVLGIAARNGIMLVSHFRHLERDEGMTFGETLVVRGATERVVPILMTALATGLALVPLVISGNRPGNEIEHPMAVVILGGLVTSTILNLLVVPALYLRLGRPAVEVD
jgi:CzcA family heavy metal efflux pump